MEAHNQIYDYNRYSRYPDGLRKKQKRELRRKASKYNLKDEILYWNDRRWIVDDEQKEEIFKSCHSDQLSGHLGRDKTRDKISSRFF